MRHVNISFILIVTSTIFAGRKKLHFAGTNFREWLFAKKSPGINFRESRFLFVDDLQPVVVGGLEVPCEVTVTMNGSAVNHLLLTRYEKLLNELYIEPKNKEIIGTFFSVANEEEK